LRFASVSVVICWSMWRGKRVSCDEVVVRLKISESVNDLALIDFFLVQVGRWLFAGIRRWLLRGWLCGKLGRKIVFAAHEPSVDLESLIGHGGCKLVWYVTYCL
jgi:hypothetical protein